MKTDSALSFPEQVRWLSEAPRPKRLCPVDATLTADAAFRLASAGTAMLWQGDFQNGRQLLQALGRRLEKRTGSTGRQVDAGGTALAPDDFHRYRMAQAQKARTLGQLVLPVDTGYVIPLRRAPDVSAACTQAFGPLTESALLPLRELQGVIGAYEWRRKGVPVPALGAAIHPHYGVFAPVRGEYIDLVARAPLPRTCALAFDIGTGTGVLAAVLARRGVQRVIATDISARALDCARENFERLGMSARVQLDGPHLFPAGGGKADLLVCNPPWLPGKAGSLLDQAVYDPDSRMLRSFLDGAAARLAPHGEAWLILSDLAEHLGLRRREQLMDWIAAGGLAVTGRLDTQPGHRRAHDATDPLHAARRLETTSLWQLAAR